MACGSCLLWKFKNRWFNFCSLICSSISSMCSKSGGPRQGNVSNSKMQSCSHSFVCVDCCLWLLLFAFFSCWHACSAASLPFCTSSLLIIFNDLICETSPSCRLSWSGGCNIASVAVWDSIQWDNTKISQLWIQQTTIDQSSQPCSAVFLFVCA